MNSPTSIVALTPTNQPSTPDSSHSSPTLHAAYAKPGVVTNINATPLPTKASIKIDAAPVDSPSTPSPDTASPVERCLLTRPSSVESQKKKRSREDHPSANPETKSDRDEPESKAQRTQEEASVPSVASEEASGDESDSAPHDSSASTNGGGYGVPRERRLKSLSQLVVLKNFYALHPRVSKDQVRKLISQTGLTHREVTRWFRNERHKEKKLRTQSAMGAPPNTFQHVPVSATQQAALMENERKRGQTSAFVSGAPTDNNQVKPAGGINGPMPINATGINQPMPMQMFNPMHMQMPMQPPPNGNFYRGPNMMPMNGPFMNGGMNNFDMTNYGGYGAPQPFGMGGGMMPMMNGGSFMPNGMMMPPPSGGQFPGMVTSTPAQQFHSAMQATTNMLMQANPSTAPYFPSPYGNGLMGGPMSYPMGGGGGLAGYPKFPLGATGGAPLLMQPNGVNGMQPTTQTGGMMTNMFANQQPINVNNTMGQQQQTQQQQQQQPQTNMTNLEQPQQA